MIPPGGPAGRPRRASRGAGMPVSGDGGTAWRPGASISLVKPLSLVLTVTEGLPAVAGDHGG